MNLTAIRRALAARLDEHGTVQVFPGPVEYDDRGMDRQRVVCRIVVGLEADEASRVALDELLEPDGVKATLEEDRGLGGLVSDLAVRKASGYRPFPGPDGAVLLGAEWTVEVLT